MTFKGTIFVHHNAATKRIEVHAVNLGPSPGKLTHNMRATEEEAYNKTGLPQHDDHGQFGHDNPVPSGSEQSPGVATVSFPVGGTYKSEDLAPNQRIPRPVTIAPGTFLRVGFRQRAFAVCRIPEPGQVVEIPYEAMLAQTGSAMLRSQWASTYAVQAWDVQPVVRDGRHVPPALQAMLAQRSPHQVKGQVRIVPVADERAPGVLAGWDVWFENKASGPLGPGETQGFTGTVVLTSRQGQGEKNAGLGLESMACPAGGAAARQRIIAGGDYGAAMGVVSAPGCPVRLGIRGFASGNTTLPSLQEGERLIDFGSLTRTYAATQSDWFDGPALAKKLGEKKNRVEFFQGGQRINDQLPDTIYAGAEAFERAEFKDPPRVIARAVDPSAEHPAGGWLIEVASLLPDADKLGPVGFPCRPRVEAAGAPALAEARFTPSARQASWFLPAMGAVHEGSELTIDTGPLGWRGTIALPGKGATFDSSADGQALLATWVLRESDYHRAGLIPGPGG